ncbi:lysophospholipid acyltransferase LPEAT1-like [Magnolia sinica]|uniref:lysophospholipid acyltransferase LPEAT1-like n=1 Tax=Magnolia sinica TaxID=86752 RepID=UPI00265B71EE|nr:lysophospholipid acyltransferase LPEAT1-like [Magnolia sinica]
MYIREVPDEVDHCIAQGIATPKARVSNSLEEGTTTYGDFLLPFKTGAFLSKTPVLPMILRYPYERFSPAWDTISAVRHVILLLCQFVNYMEVIYLPIYYPSEQEKKDLKLYVSNVRKLMARKIRDENYCKLPPQIKLRNHALAPSS